MASVRSGSVLERPNPRPAATLVRDVGFEPTDAGLLGIARYTEPFALLIAEIAYGVQAGPELAYQFERFGT